ncbi:protein Brevis radix-like 3 [Camellia sinensis]|uniref:protein Brevis radix-like 3 n=1 Tax=Camellia sinensis TaxID=4442 RepID=UPI0010360AF4|nr:protein Brevis radix-like 3 [Camellia sinensis]
MATVEVKPSRSETGREGRERNIDQQWVRCQHSAVKAPGAYKHYKPCSGSSNHNQKRNCADAEAASVSERIQRSYRRTGSSSPTPRLWGKEMETRLKGLASGEATPASGSGRTESVVFMEEDEPKEWVAQVEPGVRITVVSLPQGGNDLKRIRFSREETKKEDFLVCVEKKTPAGSEGKVAGRLPAGKKRV